MSSVTIQITLDETNNVEVIAKRIVEAIANIEIIPEVKRGNDPERTIELISKHISELIEDTLNKTTDSKLALMILEEKLQKMRNVMMLNYTHFGIVK